MSGQQLGSALSTRRHTTQRYAPIWLRKLIVRAPQHLLDRWLWPEGPPRDAWHSWDGTPWKHPWLTAANLRKMRDYSNSVLSRMGDFRRSIDQPPPSIGFVGNIANNLYNRAVPLRKAGYAADIYLHPHDRYIMSQPGWEEFDGTLPEGVRDVDALRAAGIELPDVAGVHVLPIITESRNFLIENLPAFVRLRDFLRWKSYLYYLPTLHALQQHDVLLAMQTPYLAYLSGRPYAVAQAGGDIWYECSRDDALGRLQRTSYARAAVFLVSNPWSYAHARRYGFRHLLYLPMIIDDEAYSPGSSHIRDSWRQATGGEFFVLMTSRLDDRVKGSSLGLEGFARFAATARAARLVIMAWGTDVSIVRARLAELGIEEKVLILPIVGKRLLVEYLRAADCVIDQFVLGYFGASGLEAMACGTPLIMRLERDQYDAVCSTGAPPVLDASSAEEVASHLSALARDPQIRHHVGEATRRWFLANHGSSRWREAYVDLLTTVANRRRIGFSRSPLREPLGRYEQEYHADQLRHAPRFPSYQ